jgi:hypothetical protein
MCNLLIRKSFKDLFYSIPHLPQIILWTTYQHETKKRMDQKIMYSTFSRTSTFDINYDGYHRQSDNSSSYLEIFSRESNMQNKYFKRQSSVIRKDEDLNSLDLIGLIGNSQLFVLSYPYLTITKCA